MKRRFAGLVASIFSFCLFSNGDYIINATVNKNLVDVTFKSGDGQFKDGTSTKVYSVRKGIRWGALIEGEEKPYNKDVIAKEDLTFSCWQYKNNLGELVDCDDNKTIINTSLTVYASFSSHSFNTDSWANIIDTLNTSGVGGICKKYGFGDYNAETYVAPNLIGQERYINYAGELHKVRVIGVMNDKIYDDKPDTWACLTFQFVDVITDAPYSYTSTVKENWEQSHLRDYLNNTFINNLDPVVANNLCSVKKRTYSGNNGTEKTYTETSDKVFPLSLKEMKLDVTPHNADVAEEGLMTNVDSWVTNYPYYQEEVSKIPTLSTKKKNGTITTSEEKEYNALLNKYMYKKDSNNQNTSYWLRSPDSDTSDVFNLKYSYSVNSNGDFAYQKHSYTNGVAPAFCLGVKTGADIRPRFKTASWATIQSIIENGYKGDTKTKGSGKNALKALKTQFYDDEENKEFPNTFIGITKTVKFKGADYEVRVIDELKDNLADGSGEAALTFEFVNVLPGKTDFDIKDNSVRHFDKSLLRKKCDSIYSENGNKNIKDESNSKPLNIKTVSKVYNYCSKEETETFFGIPYEHVFTWSKGTYNANVFPLSYREICNINRRFELYYSLVLINKDWTFDTVSNSSEVGTYKYYLNDVNPNTDKDGYSKKEIELANKRKKTFINEKDCQIYHLRTCSQRKGGLTELLFYCDGHACVAEDGYFGRGSENDPYQARYYYGYTNGEIIEHKANFATGGAFCL